VAAAVADPFTLPIVRPVEFQPLAAQVRRVVEVMAMVGAPLRPADQRTLETALVGADPGAAVETIQRVLDVYCLFGVSINPEARVKVAQGPARPVLAQNGWRAFLVKVHNEAGVTAPLRAQSPNAGEVFRREDQPAPLGPNADLWLELDTFDSQPLRKSLSGLNLEYRLLQCYSRDAGRREAKVSFNVGQGSQDLGFRNESDILFDCLASSEVTYRIHDEHGKPATATILIRDSQGRVYPHMAKRLAPDFGFHPQVYRADGERERLPAGDYTVEFTRGPEYVAQTSTLSIAAPRATWAFDLKRWIDPSKSGYWSGDHHIHAAGCAHYARPTEGVHAPDMMRHCLGEDLKIGCNLTWGPCFDYQKQFFTGKDDKVSQPPYLLHYDVEVSGFGSHASGHLCLLRLKDQIYPGGDSKEHWPTLCLNTLRWAKKQGAVCGPAHSGWGLEVKTDALPNQVIPPFDGIGANEYIVDVTHEVPGPNGTLVPAVDFLATVDTPYAWELNIWYHTLNVGFRTRISGETDFPCIYGERVGLGRSYVKLDGELNYHDWCEGIRQGRSYVGDGKSHLLGFSVSPRPAPGESSPAEVVNLGERGSELKLARPGPVRVNLKAAAFLNQQPNPTLQKRRYDEKPYWDIERARIGASRTVRVELVLNGLPVASQDLIADGALRELGFEATIERSSWLAVRILPSAHTNPIWVTVDNQPVRASRRSAEWCLQGVDQCWREKERFIKASELAQAREDYDHARQTYRRRLAESTVD
jgi:hypothetical protein